MPRHTLSQTIRRPIHDVFAAVTDLESHPDWDPTTTSARKLTDAEIGEGARFEIGREGFGTQELEFTEYRQDEHVRFVPRSSMMTGGHRFTFTEEGGATRLDHDLELHPRGLWKLMTPLMGFMASRAMRRSAQALEAHLEGRRTTRQPEAG